MAKLQPGLYRAPWWASAIVSAGHASIMGSFNALRTTEFGIPSECVSTLHFVKKGGALRLISFIQTKLFILEMSLPAASAAGFLKIAHRYGHVINAMCSILSDGS